jgi:hypothetical protein
VAQAAGNAVTIRLRADPDVEDTEPGSSDVAPASNALDALGWLICPTGGMEGPLEAGAFRVLSLDSELVAESVDQGTVSWTVTVKLTNVDELRQLAAQAHPDAAGLIADSLAVAWQRAADPFAPLRSIPGTAWRPGQVDVEHLPGAGRRETLRPSSSGGSCAGSSHSQDGLHPAGMVVGCALSRDSGGTPRESMRLRH